MGQIKYADRVREHARQEYIEPARRRGDSTVRIVAGDVQKAARLVNRTALVCQALKSHKFLKENRLALEKWDGPPSGMSTTVTFTYRLAGQPPAAGQPPGESPLLRLWGIGEEVFQSLGGGEAFIRSEREQWGPGEDS
jgi:5-methylcytosine-specific restriction protein B